MSSPQDTEITLGTGKLLVLFFGLVAICALFFAFGYSLGRKSEPAITTANAAALPQTSPNSSKPTGSGSAPTSAMTFYKAVEQKEANPDLTPPSASDARSEGTPSTTTPTGDNPSGAETSPNMTTLPLSAYFVQVAAVSKQEDAEALVDALKKKQYPAFIASASSSDKLFHVQVGPFSDIKDAEAMRTHLISDGYNPILKK